jgi:uncharacterized protein YbjT (DUF2867 family)
MILVTGAAGMSGTEIIKEFSAQGIPVRALVRDLSRASALDLDGVEVFELNPPALRIFAMRSRQVYEAPVAG